MTRYNPGREERDRRELAEAVAAARAELARVDAKAGIALSVSGGAFSILTATAALATSLPTLARVVLIVAAVLTAAASTAALWALRPTLPRHAGTGVLGAARVGTARGLLAGLADTPERERLAADVVCLSRLARTKYRRLRIAVDALIAAVAVVLIALVVLLATLPQV
ncbi:hypothetical protein Aple_050980 [Acrocarpospora pleiomorpha]|uniref:Pycsar effector protein domain-containing protein n=1 Tax=Acrocarpospora pleiomorpha TaxID=90975 RepID=A0A5M3XRE9_9ACTN|nr:Pycsar system effector family protein [Acrocarpospora pleiomorpha]GES22201.1 hypothetical protein Aple_050980 [Acrocarpospora pleiomorpha]